MREPLDQIGAAIPFRALGAVRLVGAAMQEQELPAGDQDAVIERKGKLVFARRRADRLPRHQVSVKRAIILIADIGEMIVGKCRVEMPAVAIDARAHGAAERGFGPSADPGLWIGRDIGGKDRAERCRHRQAAGKILAAAHGVAIAAISDRRKLAAALDQTGIEGLRFWRIDRGNRRPPRDRKRRRRATDAQRDQNAPDEC